MTLIQLKPKATMDIGSIAHNWTPRTINPAAEEWRCPWTWHKTCWVFPYHGVLKITVHTDFIVMKAAHHCDDVKYVYFDLSPEWKGFIKSRCHNSTPRLVSHLSGFCMGDTSPNFSTDMATNPKKNPVLFRYKSVAYYWLCLATSEWLRDKDCAGYHHLF